MRTPSSPTRRAAALVVTLIVIVLLTVIVISLTVAMRMEQQSAFSFMERARADLLMQEGVATARVLLQDSLGPTNGYAVTMPGRLVVATNGDASAWKTVNLYSGAGGGASGGPLSPANLNRKARTGDNLPFVDPEGGAMPIGWVYVRKNGLRETNAVPLFDAQNPVIGRYAFWVDDESARLNLNTAWKYAGNTNSPADPSRVSLAAISDSLTAQNIDALFSDSKVHPFQTSADAGLDLPAISSLLSSKRFSHTAYNHSPDLNPWGEPKIALTTHAELAHGRPYLDILASGQTDPGPLDSIDIPKLSAQLVKLNGYLSRTDWPYCPGQSFAQKFKPFDATRITQLSLDLIDYVRSAESTNNAVAMIRVKASGGGFVTAANPAGVFVGTARHPLITEIALFVTPEPVNGFYQGQARVELYSPPHYGIPSFPLKNTKQRLSIQLRGATVANGFITTATNDPLQPGDYSVLTSPLFDMKDVNGAPLTPDDTDIRVVLTDAASGDLWEEAPSNDSIPCPPGRTSIDDAPSMEVDDPRANKNVDDWKPRSSGNSFGQPNSIWKRTVDASLPQDRDGAAFSDYSLSMPPPKGQTGNEQGMVNSVAELGRVTTGAESSQAGVNWRTVRLQPTAASDAAIPDWALLDLFAAPDPTNAVTGPVNYPRTNAVAGRVNINTQIQPFQTGRSIPLHALLDPLPGLTPAQVNVMVANIQAHALATGGRSFGAAGYYKSIGELCEIAGISDSGESGEALLGQFIDLTAVRGDVFRVFSIGQSLQQTPTGGVVINATKSVEAVLEAQYDPAGTRFPTIYWHEIPF